jgi:predicted O-linked N-acetylglucosamine transferase (SPINDLY family)
MTSPSPRSLVEQGVAHHQAGRLAEAERCYRAALARNPNDADALHLLGMVAHAVKQFDAAAQLIRRAIAVNPSAAMYHNNLGVCLRGSGELEAAAESYRRAVGLKPDYAEAWANLGTVRRDQARLGESADAYGRALAIAPASPVIGASLATTRRDQGLVDEAIGLYRSVLAEQPALADAHANLCYTLHASDRATPGEIFAEHIAWGRVHAAGLADASRHDNDRAPDRRLRVGYVSADLREHAAATFLEPLIAHRDHEAFEVVCYSGAAGGGDAVTASIRSRVDGWHDVSRLDDARLAGLIRSHRIDVLIDLAGHTNGTRLLTFARKPAPVQLTYIGYPDTTGLAAMDWRITDAVADPLGETDRWHTERLARIDGCFLVYTMADDLPAVAPPPAVANGFVTFGSFNNLSKISPATLRLWRDVLSAVAGSRLVVKASMLIDPPTAEITRQRFMQCGLPMDRVELLPPVRGQSAHLATYARVDVALDTFPYNGTTTTCEALSMGVAVVSLHGRHHVSRVGLSLLTGAGLGEWATDDRGRFVEIARSLAADVPGLAGRRGGMRDRLRLSVLCDGVRLARGVEAAYRNAWRDWCVAGGNKDKESSADGK